MTRLESRRTTSRGHGYAVQTHPKYDAIPIASLRQERRWHGKILQDELHEYKILR